MSNPLPNLGIKKMKLKIGKISNGFITSVCFARSPRAFKMRSRVRGGEQLPALSIFGRGSVPKHFLRVCFSINPF
jgi:hypothetical protein